jgi:integrase
MAARRGRGEGSITLRQDGRWHSRVTIRADGKTARRSFYGRTRAEVAQKLREAQKKQDDGVPLPSERLTVGAFLQQWLDGKANLREESRRRYDDSIRLHINPILGRKVLSKLTPADLLACYAALRERGLSGTTVQHAHGVLHAALQDATRWSYVVRNVADLIQAPKRTTPEMRTLDAEETARLLIAAQGDPLEAFYTAALTCGLRLGELLALRWRHVDLDRRRLRVVATLQAVKDGEPVLSEPKTARSRREVYLSEIAIDSLRRHRTVQVERRLQLGSLYKDHDLVFANTFGRPLDGNNVRARSFKALLKRAELPPMRFHNLRHGAASLLLAEGVNVKVISEMLGHADVTVTLKVYAHLLPGMGEQAASTMDRLFASTRP